VRPKSLREAGSDDNKADEATTTVAAETTAAPATTAKAKAHWTYEGEEGPENWDKLDPAYVTCADGSAQTPIDIVTPAEADLANPVIAYTAGSAAVTNNGHTVQLSAAEGSKITVDGAEATTEIDWAAMLPSNLETYRYAGSLTTPPCTEGVTGLLLENPVELSAAQIKAFEAAYSGNARPVQPLNDREVKADNSADK